MADNSNSPSTIRQPVQYMPGQGLDPQAPNLHPVDRTYEILRQLEAQKVQDTTNSLDSLTDVSVPAPVDGQALTWVAADNEWEAITIGSGTTTTADLEANRPAGIEGDLFLPTDGYDIERKGASTWAPWGPIWPLTPPVNGDFAWVNQDGSSVATSRGGIYLEHPSASTGTSASLRVKTAPATPYTLTVWLQPNVAFNKPFLMVGLVFRESGTGKLVTWHVNNGFMWATKWNSATAINSDYLQTDALLGAPTWWQIADDGTNLKFRVGRSGYSFAEYLSKGRTDFLAGGPNQIGFFVNAQNNATPNLPCGGLLLSWKET